MSEGMFPGGGPWMGVQMMCLGDQTRHGVSREDAQSWGVASQRFLPAWGIARPTFGMSWDVPKGMDTLFGMSGAFCGRCNVSHVRDTS